MDMNKMVNIVSYNDSHSLTFFIESMDVNDFIAVLRDMHKRDGTITVRVFLNPEGRLDTLSLKTQEKKEAMVELARLLDAYATKSNKHYGRHLNLVQFSLELKTNKLSVYLERDCTKRRPSCTPEEWQSIRGALLALLDKITKD